MSLPMIAKLATSHPGINSAETVITDGAPDSATQDLQTTFTCRSTADKSQIWKSNYWQSLTTVQILLSTRRTWSGSAARSWSLDTGPDRIRCRPMYLESKYRSRLQIWHADWPRQAQRQTKKRNIRSNGSEKGHVTYFLGILEPLPYFGNGWSQKLHIWHAYWTRWVLTKNAKLGQKEVVKGHVTGTGVYLESEYVFRPQILTSDSDG